MENNNISIFKDFAAKAAKRLEEMKKQNVETLHIGSLDADIQVRGLSDTEFMDCSEFSEDELEVDKYTIFYASKTLQETAKMLVNDGVLAAGREYKITEMFTGIERGYIVGRILSLSGLTGEADITVVKECEEIKNS